MKPGASKLFRMLALNRRSSRLAGIYRVSATDSGTDPKLLRPVPDYLKARTITKQREIIPMSFNPHFSPDVLVENKLDTSAIDELFTDSGLKMGNNSDGMIQFTTFAKRVAIDD